VFNAVAATDPGQLNNVVGNVIYAVSPIGGTAINGITSSSSSMTTGQSDAFSSRVNQALTFNTDTFAGFQLNGMYTLNNSNSTVLSSSQGGNSNSNGWGLGVNYTWQKLFLTANYQALRSFATAYTSLTSPLPAAWTGPSNTGVETQDNQTYVAATYDFGILKAYGQWVNRKVTDTLNSNYYAKRNAQQLGVRSFITPTIEGWASIGNGKITAFGQSNPSANFNAYQLGGNYWLSKRTNLYAIYGSNQVRSYLRYH